MDPPAVFSLLDASHSMSRGTDGSRWDAVTAMIREAQGLAGSQSHARLNLFRFGQKLTAIEPSQINLDLPEGLSKESTKSSGSAGKKPPPPAQPTDSDTQIAGALRQLSSPFGPTLPASVVLFSHGQP